MNSYSRLLVTLIFTCALLFACAEDISISDTSEKVETTVDVANENSNAPYLPKLNEENIDFSDFAIDEISELSSVGMCRPLRQCLNQIKV